MTEPAEPQTSADPEAEIDLRLMERVRDGDEGTFAALVERHQHRVYGVVARMLGSEDGAEDIAQQVFIRVWKSASRYRPEARFTTWLFKITRNLVFNEIRRRRRHPTEPIEREDAQPLADASAVAPDAELLQRELESAINAAIAALPENQRTAVVLRRYEELSYEEIAAVMESSVPAVKSLLFRAREELRAKLERYLARR